MEGGTEAEKNKPPEGGEAKSKRQMKTAAQLEVLEKTYAVESYPSEATRAELSAKLGLSDRQLQMWFCHRRLKDRKPTPSKRQRKDSLAIDSKSAANANELVVGEAATERATFGQEVDHRRALSRPGMALSRVGGDVIASRRYSEPSPQLAAELRTIAFVEAQLGERLREDGPILGMEFDPLPPGAFGTPIVGAETPMHRKRPVQAYETNFYERADAKPIKDPVRTIREYQFLPEQPSARPDHYERVSPSGHTGVPIDASVMRTSSASAVHSFSHRDEHVPYGYGYSTQIPNLNLSTHQGRPGHVLPSTSGEYDLAHRKNFMDTASHGNFDAHPIHTVENPFVLSERKGGGDEDVLRMERKRKSEEARIAREVEAHEKRIRKELEKQDMLRRKREEQMRKEMERLDRERRKEEERLLRERQKEEVRYLKEQRREMLRREKFLLKESMRAEKLRQKEELRREKEAARLRAANERAIARKIAKESMELIEDERLELMEAAASSKGMPSMLSLDYETLQNLDVYRDKLAMFPPKSVTLKKPFAIRPWNGSEDNVGNLFMVWRFLITFADVLGIWPFTLDEFAQALHDHDPRLMGEVHIVLLRTIIKDIEDVARTSSVGVGANQNNSANPGGGHPHIVEGAYAWGFDIRSWKRHLNALTWPEILRQFALSAGFGPKLKKCNIEQHSVSDDNEVNNSENVIFNLRHGVAAENAFAKLQERGLSNPRRSRHRLTPGTVKYAAFHVLSLEGEKGLTILDVAEKIQKSGLRDLTTSKTPEASIAAALSRDTKLFERVAPSTYCVRAPYRKDMVDAEAVLSEARERIRIFKSGATDVEDVDDAERDEDSESDAGDDPEVDDLVTDLNPKKETPDAQETENPISVKPLLENGLLSVEVGETTQSGLSVALCEDMKEAKKDGSLADQSLDTAEANFDDANLEQEDPCFDESRPGEPWVQGLIEGEYSDLSVEERLSALVALIGVAIEGNSIRVILEERLEAASALKKQMWAEVQLDKRRIKEEFAMRVNYASYPGSKTEPHIANPATEDRKSPLTIRERTTEMSTDPIALQECFVQNDQNYVNNVYSGGNLHLQDTAFGQDTFQYQQQGYVADKERLRAQLKAYVGCKAEELYMYRSLPLGQDRRRNRYWRFTVSASLSDPGCGRIFVELCDGRWRLIDSEEGFDSLMKSLDLRGVRESHLHFMLQKIETSFKEAIKRNALHASMQRTQEIRCNLEAEANPSSCSNISSPGSSICGLDSDTADISTMFKIELGDNIIERCGALKRYQDFEKWMWENIFDSANLSAFKYGEKKSKALFCICNLCHEVYIFEDAYCPSCHQISGSSTSDLHFSEQVAQLEDSLKGKPSFFMHGSVSSPLRIRLLKIQLALVEASLPSEGLQSIWTEEIRKSWGLKLQSLTTAEELLQVLTLLESAVKRDYLSSNFETSAELLGISKELEAFELFESVPVLPWIPKMTAAVALRLFEFDNSITYTPNQKADMHKDKESGDFLVLGNNVLRNAQGNEATETPSRTAYAHEESWAEMGLGLGCSSSGRGGRSRGRGRPRSRGGRSERRVTMTSSRSVSGRRANANANANGEGLEPEFRPKAQARAAGARKRGRRGARSRKRPTKGALRIANGRSDRKPATRNIDDDWNENEIGNLNENENETSELHADGAEEDASSSGRSLQYNYDDGQAMVDDEYDDGFETNDGGSNKLLGRGEFNLHSDEEDYEDDDYGDEHEGNMEVEVEDYINEEWEGEEPSGNRYDDDQQNLNNAQKTFGFEEDPDLTSSSSSSGFSD